MQQEKDKPHSSGMAASLAEEVDVVVVGAGISGLACAQHLARHAPWLRVVVVEARGRIGGRIDSSELGPSVVAERGAAWIHGAVARATRLRGRECGRLDLAGCVGSTWCR